MRLYIAEKPSVGRELAKCLTGPIARHDGYLVTKDGVVTWLFGHILRQAEPEEYDPKYKRWRADDLPIIPEHWKLFVAKDCEKQFAIVKSLIEKADEIVHGGDPDREGQLLVDEVLDYLGNKKPVRRILLNALDEKSIKKHRHDVCRLATLLMGDERPVMSEGVCADMRRFMEAYESDPVDPKALKIKGVTAQQVVKVLRSVYLR